MKSQKKAVEKIDITSMEHADGNKQFITVPSSTYEYQINRGLYPEADRDRQLVIIALLQDILKELRK